MEEGIYYPPVGFHFKAVFQGKGISGETSFKEISGLTVAISPEEVKEGGELRFVHRLPTVPKYSNLVLKRGLVTDSWIRSWVERAVKEFVFQPLLLTIQLLNENHKPLMSWVAYNVWPVKWEVSNFDSMSNSLVIESMELAFDYFETKS